MRQTTQLRFDVNLTNGDYLDLWNASPVRHSLWIFYLIAAFYLYWAFAIFVNDGYTKETSYTIISFCGVSVFALAVAHLVPRIRTRFAFRGPVFSETKTMSIDDEGVRSDSALTTAHYRWGAFTSVSETKSCFVFYISPVMGVIVPKRCISSDHGRTALRELVRASFQGKLRLKGSTGV